MEDQVVAALVAKAEAVALRPGDTLVISFKQQLTAEQVATLRERWQAAAGDANKVAFITDASYVRREPPAPERPEHRACRRQS